MLQTEIAVMRFGLGARPGDLQAALPPTRAGGCGRKRKAPWRSPAPTR